MVGQAPRPRHYEFERARPDGLGGWEASRHGRASASKLPIPQAFQGRRSSFQCWRMSFEWLRLVGWPHAHL
jgi:hypothetical protein